MRDVQAQVALMAEKYGLGADPMTRFADLTSEVGELGKELVKSSNYGKNEPAANEKLAMEMGDVLFVLVLLANEMELDLDECFRAVREKCEERFEEKGSIGS